MRKKSQTTVTDSVALTDDEGWVKATAKKRRSVQCTVCLDPAAPRLRELLLVVIRLKARTIPKAVIYERLCELDPGARERFSEATMSRHMREGHVPEWKGRSS